MPLVRSCVVTSYRLYYIYAPDLVLQFALASETLAVNCGVCIHCGCARQTRVARSLKREKLAKLILAKAEKRLARKKEKAEKAATRQKKAPQCVRW